MRLRVPHEVTIARRRVSLNGLAFWAFAILSLSIELAVAQRLSHVLGATMFVTTALTRPVEIAVFAAALVSGHLVLLWLAYLLLAALHGRRAGSALVGFNFFCFGATAYGLILTLRLRLSSFFADKADLALLRGLAAGSLRNGLGYARTEILFLLSLVVGAALLYLILLSALNFSSAPARRRAARGGLLRLAIALAVAVLLFFSAARVPNVRAALERFAAPWTLYHLLDLATDFDRDGYSAFTDPPDTALFDGNVHPFALDVPDNGIDEDGLAGDFHYIPRPDPYRTVRFGPHRKHVVLVVLESTRADAVGKKWGGRVVAPVLTELARRGSSAPEAYSNIGITRESLRSIFGGEIPPLTRRESLFRDFKTAGYRIGVLSMQSEDWGGTAEDVGMRESADIFADARVLIGYGTPGDALLLAPPSMILRAFDRSFGTSGSWSRPTFLYVNIQSAHFPYDPPEARNFLPGTAIPYAEIGASNRAWVARSYWNAVANGDWLLGQLISRLKALGVYDDTVVAVVGDHGEELFENGHVGHGLVLDRLSTQVPFVLSTPGIPLPRPVGLASLRPILLRAAGAELPPLAGSPPVLQLLLQLDRPMGIGMVEAGGRWTTFTPQGGSVWSSETGARRRYGSLAAMNPLRRKVNIVANLWEAERWEHWLRRERTPR
ncbi:MAG TPA: sulfatase-like hydrolase/transferase [Allosphingosinicella sp.]|jgi:hypothetical protein|nr:sulfatase-like hydrolase/transferase [Allosphingosinicella sp.]